MFENLTKTSRNSAKFCEIPLETLPGQSTITRRRIIDQTERTIEPTEPNLTKKKIVFGVSVFFGIQASYKAEILTPVRSQAPRRFQKIENHTESTEPIDSIDRPRDQSNRSLATVLIESASAAA